MKGEFRYAIQVTIKEVSIDTCVTYSGLTCKNSIPAGNINTGAASHLSRL